MPVMIRRRRLATLTGAALAAGLIAATPALAITPNIGEATADGDPSEWDLSPTAPPDFFASLRVTTSNNANVAAGRLHARYSCTDEKLRFIYEPGDLYWTVTAAERDAGGSGAALIAVRQGGVTAGLADSQVFPVGPAGHQGYEFERSIAPGTTVNPFKVFAQVLSPAGSTTGPFVVGATADLPLTTPACDEPTLEPLTATKTAVPSYTRLHRWDITKTPNREVFYNHDKRHVAVDYTVRAHKKSAGVRDVRVAGAITISNPNDSAVDLGPIVDALPGASCAVAISPASIAASATIRIPYTCTFPDQVPQGVLTNTATVSFGDGESTQATAPVNFAAAKVGHRHNAVKVIDRLGDGATKVLADKLTTSSTFTYRRYLRAPEKPSCVYHPNTARVIGLAPNGEMERADGGLRILATATAKVRVCQKAPTPPSSEDPKPPSTSEDPPKVIITSGSSEDPKEPKPRPAVVKPDNGSEDPKPPVSRKAKLRVTKRAKVKHTRIGKKLVFTITVKNTGRKAAKGVILRDRLPRHLRALRTSMPRKSIVRKRLVRITLDTIRPGAKKRVRIVAYAASRPTMTPAVTKKIAQVKDRTAKAKMRYRARKGIVCNVAFAGAKNAARSNRGVACVRVHPRPAITEEDRDSATPR